MTTLLSDGREYVYAVFGADGCECDSLEAIFGTQAEADEHVQYLRSLPMMSLRDGAQESEDASFYGRADLLEVRCIEVRTTNSSKESETRLRYRTGESK